MVSPAPPSSCHLQGRRDAADPVSSVTTPTRRDNSGRKVENRRKHTSCCNRLPVPGAFTPASPGRSARRRASRRRFHSASVNCTTQNSEGTTCARSRPGPRLPQQADGVEALRWRCWDFGGTNIGDGSDLSGSLEIIFDSIKSDAKTYSVPA